MFGTSSRERSQPVFFVRDDCALAPEAGALTEAFALAANQNQPVKNHGAFPVWHPQRGPDATAAQMISEAARNAGMYIRPVRETVRDLLSWWQTLPEERTSKLQAGVAPEYEAELIARWKQQQA